MKYGSGPVLTEKASLSPALPAVAPWKQHTVARGEEQRGGLPQQLAEPPLGGLASDDPLDLPGRVLASQGLRQGLQDLAPGELGLELSRVLRPEEDGARAVRRGRDLGCHHPGGIPLVLLGPAEAETAHRVLHIELVLELIGDLRRRADEEQVIGHVPRLHGPGPHSEPLEETPGRHPGLGRRLKDEIAVESTRLLLPVLQQRPQGTPDLLWGVRRENDPPTGRGQIPGIDAGAQSPGPQGLRLTRESEPSEILVTRRGSEISSRRAIDAGAEHVSGPHGQCALRALSFPAGCEIPDLPPPPAWSSLDCGVDSGVCFLSVSVVLLGTAGWTFF